MLILVIFLFTIKDKRLFVPIVTLPSILSKGFERSVYWNEYKTKSGNKNMANEYKYFLKSIFFGVNKIRNAFANNISTDIKLSKAQKSKRIQSSGPFSSW